MRLKTLELQGFKSFPDKTVIAFDKGITVVVGPNGSGKSNISDAMRWVLGEMSTKSMRGSKMEDVIFSGSQKRSPMGFAEVTVTFDNSGMNDSPRFQGMDDYDEVSVSRRYYRTGESEYYINKKQCRLRDVRELFMNTGMGKGGYSIIGQGKIAEIVSQKSEERRAVFEEAAGISKYRYQKEDAERKLEQTNTNLQGAEIILNELEGRVGPLKKESEKAKKYLEIYEQKKALDISLSLYDIDRAKEKVKDVEEKLLVSKTELENLDDTKQALGTQNQDTYNAFMQSKADIENNLVLTSEANERALKITSEIKVAEANKKNYELLSDNSESKLTEDQQHILAAKKEYEAVLKELREAEKRKNEVLEQIDGCEEEVSEKNKDLDGIGRQIAEFEELIEISKQGEVDAKVEASVARTRMSTSKGNSVQLDDEIKKHGEDRKKLEEQQKLCKEKIDDYGKKAEDIKKSLDGFDAEKAKIADRQKKNVENKNSLFLEISQRRHKVQNYIRMDELLDGYSSAVKFVVNENAAGRIPEAVVYGPVSKLIEVESKYSTALEVAFGGSLQNIVVQDEKSAKNIIAYLKKKNAGRVTLYPLSTMTGRSIDDRDRAVTSQNGFISVASDLVKCDKKYQEIIRSLVGRILICDNLDHASLIARFCSFRYKIVTLDGQVVNAGGSFTGGSVSGEGGMLSRRAVIDTLNSEIAALEKKSAEADAEEARLKNELDSVAKNEGTVLGQASVVRMLLDAEEKEQVAIKTQIDTIAETITRLNDEKNVEGERVAKEEKNIEELNRKQQECHDKQIELREKIVELENARTDSESEMDEIRKARTELDIKLAKESQFFEIKTESANASKARLDECQQVYDSDCQSRNDLASKISQNEETIRDLTEQLKNAENEKKNLESAKGNISEESERLQKRLDEIRTKENDTQHRRELVFEEYTKLDNLHNQLLEKQDGLLAFLWDTYEMTYSAAAALGYEKITKEARSEAAAQQAKYKNIMRSLGNVNVDAIEEYNQVKDRYEYYSKQIGDLHQSREDLEGIISSLNTDMETDFRNTIDEVNGYFGKVFSELFGGGHAELKLTDPKNILESGIDINVAPPGKIIKNLSLLSGGEQAFVAIALYFAIFKVNPSPFCILDEIESALDEVNVDKFADYVKNYSDKTQFLIITHRRGTMEAAERLYGVTMHEKGISDVLSIDVSEIESKIGADIK